MALILMSAAASGAAAQVATPDAASLDAVAVGADHVAAGVANFYDSREHATLWVRDGRPTAQAAQLIGILRRGAAQGLAVDGAATDRLAAALTDVRPGRTAAAQRAELLASESWVRFVQALSAPNQSKMEYLDSVLAPRRRFAVEILGEAAAASSLADHLTAVARVNPMYDGLARRLADWRARWDGAPPVAIPAGPALKAGDRGERVRLLRARLGLPAIGSAGAVFDSATVTALGAFGRKEGVTGGAVADAAVVARLNVSASETDRRLRLNLERARALTIGRTGKYVVVDAAGARLWMFEGGEVAGSMKVVVGKATEPTPMAAGLIRSLVLNPYWNLPPDLVRDRFAARAREGGARYMTAHGYQVLSGWDDRARVLDPRQVDWRAVEAGRQQVRMRQLPGSANAMGTMKFMFPNRFGVYLHDTPSRALFDEVARSFSSGCVRLEDAPRLARWLFGAVPKGDGRAEEAVALKTPVPVYLTYLTVDWREGVTSSNSVRADIYGRDGS